MGDGRCFMKKEFFSKKLGDHQWFKLSMVSPKFWCPRNSPHDDKVPGSGNRIIYQKLVEGKLLRVITEGDLLITAYMTDKIEKYTRG
jgi:hypothetical protein